MRCRWDRGWAASHPLDGVGLVGGVVVAGHVHVQLGGCLRVDGGQERAELHRAVAAVGRAGHLPGGHVQRGEQAGGPVAGVVVGTPLRHARHHRQHRLGPVQGLDLGLLVDAQHQRLLRRVHEQAHHVADLVDELRVGRQLERLRQVRLEPERFQTRPTVVLDSPDLRAIDARDQWVASRGVSSSVATTTSPTFSSVMVGGAPGRGSSTSPSSRRPTNRDRHVPTVGCDTPSPAATAASSAPPAHRNTIRDRNASCCGLLGRRSQRRSVARPTSDKTNPAFGRPRPAIPADHHI